jgi:hypothetical protein
VVRVTIVNKALAEEAERLAPGGEVWHRVWEATKYAGLNTKPAARPKRAETPAEDDKGRQKAPGRKKKAEGPAGQATWLQEGVERE